MPRSRMLASLTVPILAFALVAPGSPALAQGTLDQQQTDASNRDAQGDPDGYLAQTVQAGLTGRLVRVDVMPSGDFGNDADGMTVAIQGVSNGAPDGHTVASAIIDSTVVDDWVSVTFTDPVNVTAGEVFAIVVGPSNGRYVTLHTASAAYANGSLWFAVGAGGWDISYADHDMTFRTYVDTTYGFAWTSPTKGKGHGVNKPRAGSTVPVTFTLDTKIKASQVLASGWPKVRRVDCSTKAPIPGTEWLSRPFGAKGLTRDGNAYTYSWHVRPEWGNGPLACRELRIKLTDGTTHSALFRFQPATKR